MFVAASPKSAYFTWPARSIRTFSSFRSLWRKRMSALWFRQLSHSHHNYTFLALPIHTMIQSRKKIGSFMNWMHYRSGMIINLLDTTKWTAVQPFINNTIEIGIRQPLYLLTTVYWAVLVWSSTQTVYRAVMTNHSYYMMCPSPFPYNHRE